jgi:hypothetical protein
MNPPSISPSAGRVVWYHPSVHEGISKPPNGALAALVTCVWSDRCVNLAIFDANGHHHARTSVTLVQPGDARPVNGGFCEWMPYQVGQAVALRDQQPAKLQPREPLREVHQAFATPVDVSQTNIAAPPGAAFDPVVRLHPGFTAAGGGDFAGAGASGTWAAADAPRCAAVSDSVGGADTCSAPADSGSSSTD